MPLPVPVLGAGSQRQPQAESAPTGQQKPARVQRRFGGKPGARPVGVDADDVQVMR
mgnify:CR=1 FL=1